MFPNYRTSAAHRRGKLGSGCAVAGVILAGVFALSLYGAIAYVAAHFIGKFW